MPTNRQILKADGTDPITTSSLTYGLLSPEQAKQFLVQMFDSNKLGQMIRTVRKTAKAGEIDKIGINSRILRSKTEAVDDGYRAGINTDVIEYSTTAVRLPWEVSGETFRQNIEGEDIDKQITDLMTTALGLDMIDLAMNGDSDTLETDEDYNFLKINDGWRKQLMNGSHIVDATEISGTDGALMRETFFAALNELPTKYNKGTLKWLCSAKKKQAWEDYLFGKSFDGGNIPQSFFNAPYSIEVVDCYGIPDDTLILTDPKNLIVVNTYDMKILSTNQGKEAVMKDMVYYNCHLDFDPIIEELDAAVIVTGIV